MILKIYIFFVFLLFFIFCQSKYNIEKVNEVYNSVKNDILLFKDYQISKRGKAFLVYYNNDGSVLTFNYNKGGSKYKYLLRDRDSFVEEYCDFYKKYNFNDEHSFMIYMTKMIQKFEDLDVYAIFGNKRKKTGESIKIAVTPFDMLIYCPVDMKITNDFYEWTLERGELSELDSNWFYLKMNKPINLN